MDPLVTENEFKALLLVRAVVTIWINFGQFLSILVHLMGVPTTPP